MRRAAAGETDESDALDGDKEESSCRGHISVRSQPGKAEVATFVRVPLGPSPVGGAVFGRAMSRCHEGVIEDVGEGEDEGEADHRPDDDSHGGSGGDLDTDLARIETSAAARLLQLSLDQAQDD